MAYWVNSVSCNGLLPTSHCLSQCCSLTNMILWHSTESNFTIRAYELYADLISKLTTTYHWHNKLNMLFFADVLTEVTSIANTIVNTIISAVIDTINKVNMTSQSRDRHKNDKFSPSRNLMQYSGVQLTWQNGLRDDETSQSSLPFWYSLKKKNLDLSSLEENCYPPLASLVNSLTMGQWYEAFILP